MGSYHFQESGFDATAQFKTSFLFVLVASFLVFLSYSQREGTAFHRKVGEFIPDYTTSHPTRLHFSNMN
jgi:hypothetical protein